MLIGSANTGSGALTSLLMANTVKQITHRSSSPDIPMTGSFQFYELQFSDFSSPPIYITIGASIRTRTNTSGTPVDIHKCVFNECHATGIWMPEQIGGAVYVSDAPISAFLCSFTNCSAQFGGAIGCYRGSLLLTTCYLGSNKAESIGAIWSMSCSGTSIDSSNFSKNSATNDFGAVAINASSPTISNCNFYNSSAPSGCSELAITGGISAIISNSVFGSNSEEAILMHLESPLGDTLLSVTLSKCFFAVSRESVISVEGSVLVAFDAVCCEGTFRVLKADETIYTERGKVGQAADAAQCVPGKIVETKKCITCDFHATMQLTFMMTSILEML